MSIQILNVGVGLGGGRFTQALSTTELFTKAFYLNIAEDELNLFKGDKNKLVRIATTDGGAGKDRNVAKNHFKNDFNGKKLVEDIIATAEAEKVDVINVSYSLGGGTGSGIGINLVKMLRDVVEAEDSKHRFIVMGIGLLPMMAEGLISFQNTLVALKEVRDDMADGGRHALVKNADIGSKGADLNEKYDAVNKKTASVYLKYLKGTTKPSPSGVLDLNDRRTGLRFDGLHAFFDLADGEIVESGFIGPNTDVVTAIVNAEIPSADAELYEDTIIKMQKLDHKFGYTEEEEGSLAMHGFGGLEKIVVDLRERFDDLKKESFKADSNTGRNALSDLEAGVVNFKPGRRFASSV